MEKGLANIGIVILPPDDIWEWLVSLSSTVNKPLSAPEVKLGDVQKPHLSLMHSYIDFRELNKIYSTIGTVVKEFHPFSLTTTGIHVEQLESTLWISVEVVRSEPLQRLHTKISDVLIPFEREQRRSREFAYENYRPHFTLAVDAGEVSLEIEPRTFNINRVVACQLGDAYSTCDEILKEWKLGE